MPPALLPMSSTLVVNQKIEESGYRKKVKVLMKAPLNGPQKQFVGRAKDELNTLWNYFSL